MNAPMDKLGVESSFPLTTAQEIIWIDQARSPSSPRYNIGCYVRMDGEIDSDCFERALRWVVDRTDALRLVMVGAPGEAMPRQRVIGSVESVIERIDLTVFDDAEARAGQIIAQTFDEPFTRFDRPLWRFRWLEVAPARACWVICLHHLI